MITYDWTLKMSDKGQTTYKNVKKWRKIDYERCIFIFIFFVWKRINGGGSEGRKVKGIFFIVCMVNCIGIWLLYYLKRPNRFGKLILKSKSRNQNPHHLISFIHPLFSPFLFLSTSLPLSSSILFFFLKAD